MAKPPVNVIPAGRPCEHWDVAIMELKILGEHPLALAENGMLKCRIATIFVNSKTLVTVRGVHATQRLAYGEHLDQQQLAQGLLPLTDAEHAEEWKSAVDLIVEPGIILIRPDPNNMPLAFEADQLLQELISKRQIHFLYVRQEKVQEAIRRRGEYWRISPVPQAPDDIAKDVIVSRIGIGGLPIYYYSAMTGTRYLTVQEFIGLGTLDDEELRLHLAEIRDYASRLNRFGSREIAFFGADKSFGPEAFAGRDFENGGQDELHAWHAELAERFCRAVPQRLHNDQVENLFWRNRMFSALIGDKDDTVSEEVLCRITPEFFRQIRWLPGGRVDNGELNFDDLFTELEANPANKELNDLCDERVKRLICNYVREFGSLEYVNIGRLAPALRRRRPQASGHRAYIAEVKHRGAPEPVLRIVRLQKWGIREHLEEGKELLHSIMESEEYTEFILDRRLGGWQLGMSMPGRIDTRQIAEIYRGSNRQYQGTRIWTTYFERDFILGMATDKIPPARFRDEPFALEFARLLGQAAAPNMIVGRTTLDGLVIFDDGDEIVLLDDAGMPQRIISADHAGTFTDCESELVRFAAEYARPVTSRTSLVANPAAFSDAYVTAFVENFQRIQGEYRKQRRAFDTLFKHSKQGDKTFAWRWSKVLDRLDRTKPTLLAQQIRSFINLYL
jgi:hypothetical protein